MIKIIDQFAHFCAANHNQPGFGSRLVRYYGQNIFSPEGSKIPLIWLEASACSGDTISTLNAVEPNVGQLICEICDVRYWDTLMLDQGPRAQEQFFNTVAAGGYILAVEGAIATAAQGRYAVVFQAGDYRYTSLELVTRAAQNARFILAVGTCASFGGPSAARPNPSGCKGVGEVVPQPVINVSGCPVNPDWLAATLVYVLNFGMPELDPYRRPAFLYGRTVHSVCQRRAFFDSNRFAKELGAPECMISKGCMGPVTGSDCPYRMWNDHLNWPVKASTPCIGCTNAGFPDESTPFYTPLRQKRPQPGQEGEES